MEQRVQLLKEFRIAAIAFLNRNNIMRHYKIQNEDFNID